VPGGLVLAATPLGDSRDASPRLREALATADVVAAEDTRRLRSLAAALGVTVHGRVVSHYDAVEVARMPRLLADVRAGRTVLVVTDAGMPAVSDPGYRLVAAAAAEGLPVTCLPGPSAVTTALVASGLPPDRWRFEGYLPRRAGELERVLSSPETVVAFESPRRLPASLSALAALAPDRPAAVCRELTKLHEEVARGSLSELARRFREEAKGEIVLVIVPAASDAAGGPDVAFAVDALRRLVQSGARPRAAASVVAALTGTRANDLYRGLTGRDPRE